MSFIEVRHLRKEYANVVPLKDVNATIDRGEVICFFSALLGL